MMDTSTAEELKVHVAARNAQADYRKRLREDIPEDTLVIHFDFSNYNMLPNIHAGKDAIQTVWDFIVVVEWMEDGVKHHRNLHFLCDSPANRSLLRWRHQTLQMRIWGWCGTSWRRAMAIQWRTRRPVR